MGRKTKQNKITSPELIAQINPKNIRLMNDFLEYLRSVGKAETTVKAYTSDLYRRFGNATGVSGEGAVQLWIAERFENRYVCAGSVQSGTAQLREDGKCWAKRHRSAKGGYLCQAGRLCPNVLRSVR